MSSFSQDRIVLNYFNEVLAAFHRAENTSKNPIMRSFQIGGHNIHLIFANSSLIPYLCPAIEHLEIFEYSIPDLTILLWDKESTGIEIPDAPWDVADYIKRKEIWYFDSERLKINYSPHKAEICLIDLEKKLAIYYSDKVTKVAEIDSKSPLIQIFFWWFKNAKKYIIHAAAVGEIKGGVLLVGKSGSGKSTTALVCLEYGMFYVSDDYCLLDNSNRPYVYSLYNSAKVHRNEINHYPLLMNHSTINIIPDTEEALFFLNRRFGNRLKSGFPVKTVLLPYVTGLNDSDLIPISPAEALLSLAPSTILQLRERENHSIREMSRLVSLVPCYTFLLGTNKSKIIECIKKVL